MSGTALGWAWKQKVDDPTAKLLLVKLADQANDDGECWPSKRTLAASIGVSTRTVARHSNTLAALGLVSVEARATSKGRQRSNLYVLRLGEGDADVTPLPADVSPSGATPVSPPKTSSSESSEGISAPRRRNVVWDILVEHFGEPTTKSETSDFGKTVAEVKAALVAPIPCSDLDPLEEAYVREEVGRRVEVMGEQQYRTHRRLRNQWAELGRRAEVPADEVGQAIREEVDRTWERCGCGTEVRVMGSEETTWVFNPHCPECGGTGKDGWVS